MLKVENREGSVTEATGEGKAHQSPEAIPWRVQTGVWSHRHTGVTQKNLERLAECGQKSVSLTMLVMSALVKSESSIQRAPGTLRLHTFTANRVSSMEGCFLSLEEGVGLPDTLTTSPYVSRRSYTSTDEQWQTLN